MAEIPALNDLLGNTIITTDGITLLGGGDKAGVVAIMECRSSLTQSWLSQGDS